MLIAKKNLEKFNTQIIQLYQQGKVQEALTLSQQALERFPNDINLLANAAGFAAMLNQLDLAQKYFQKTLKLNPNHADTHNNLANLLKNQKQFEKAMEHFQIALKINPNHADAHSNLAVLFKEQKQFEKAMEHFQTALKINFHDVGLQFNFSLLQLTLINFNQGWQGYEFRYHPKKQEKITLLPTTTIPQYQNNNPNQDLAGKHLLIIPEQGVGDEIMFASVLSELKPIVQQNPNTQITLACDARLVELFNRSFDFLSAIPKDPDNRYADLEKDLDYWLFIDSLPKFYRNDIKDFDKHKPYLIADKMLFSIWKNRFNKLKHNINIGISWTGGKKAEQKKERSLTLQQMQPILKKASQKANLINLQYGDHTQEIQNFTAQTNITIHDWEDADPLKDLDNFTSQIKALDLVISIDNSTVHFAGALGTKTYLMLPFNQDWRWAEERADSYWYPNIMTLFRQSKDGQWDEVIQNVTNALE